MATVESNTNLDSILRENRVFPPPQEFAANAHIKSLAEYEAMYRRSIEQPEEFWAEAAGELDWFAPWTKVTEGEAQHAKWADQERRQRELRQKEFNRQAARTHAENLKTQAEEDTRTAQQQLDVFRTLLVASPRSCSRTSPWMPIFFHCSLIISAIWVNGRKPT